jgi:hypothetical protein
MTALVNGVSSTNSARSFFEHAALEFFLALDAVTRPRDGLEALGVDFFAAVDALAETALANAGESFLDQLKELAVVVALAEEKFFGVGASGAVGYILSSVFVSRAAISLVPGNGAAQVLLPGFQPLLKGF